MVLHLRGRPVAFKMHPSFHNAKLPPRYGRAVVKTGEAEAEKGSILVHDMMSGGMTGMMWGMGVVGLIVAVLVVLALAALVKYLFFTD